MPDAPRLRVMLVDDHAVVRAGYRRLLEMEGDVEVIAECADAATAQSRLDRLDPSPAVVVVDLSMPGRGGLDLLRRGSLRWPAVAWLVFSMHDSAPVVGHALRAGAAGFVSKSAQPDELVAAVRRVAGGDRPVFSAGLERLARSAAAERPHQALTAREFEVLRLLVHGLPVGDIAERLHLSPKTVSNLQTRIRSRLGVASAVELLRYAQQHQLFMP